MAWQTSLVPFVLLGLMVCLAKDDNNNVDGEDTKAFEIFVDVTKDDSNENYTNRKFEDGPCWLARLGCTLRGAIHLANQLDDKHYPIIKIDPGTFAIDSPLPPIRRKMIIMGYGAVLSDMDETDTREGLVQSLATVLDGQGRHRLLYFSGEDEGGKMQEVEIHNIRFQNGSALVGGAIATSMSLHISNCHFKHNKASHGGCIYSTGGHASVFVWHCYFSHNEAIRMGSVFYATAMEVYAEASKFSFNINGGQEGKMHELLADVFASSEGGEALDVRPEDIHPSRLSIPASKASIESNSHVDSRDMDRLWTSLSNTVWKKDAKGGGKGRNPVFLNVACEDPGAYFSGASGYYADYFHMLQFICNDGTMTKPIGLGWDKSFTFQCPKDSGITRVDVGVGAHISSVRFHCGDHISPQYGGGGGQNVVVPLECKGEAEVGEPLYFVKGRGGYTVNIHNLGFMCRTGLHTPMAMSQETLKYEALPCLAAGTARATRELEIAEIAPVVALNSLYPFANAMMRGICLLLSAYYGTILFHSFAGAMGQILRDRDEAQKVKSKR